MWYHFNDTQVSRTSERQPSPFFFVRCQCVFACVCVFVRRFSLFSLACGVFVCALFLWPLVLVIRVLPVHATFNNASYNASYNAS